ncbi:AAA family ATPase [Lysobacter sp. 5GHs7-4]|uniref:ATP-dependent nuclease n=1 Tax=Lysobacter sp. 5GHs7-4 TaxID=2904253 RepID=UPI001E2CF1A8|nr:AAA family ATPase [Lysobacter sp. 5GHs7-4]UHQ23786.1 AAA family ATPase [Lysobacter sp. 5GHs7-4]
MTNVAVELDDLTVLVGANNAGKTSFLEAIYAAVGAGRRSLGQDDIHVGPGEAVVPQDRVATIDVCVRPFDADGKQIDAFPAGSYWTSLWGTGISQDNNFHDFMAFRTTLAWNPAKGDYVLDRRFLTEWKTPADWLTGKISTEGLGSEQLEHVALHYIDAKRDLEDDLRRQGSFWRRLTDNLGLTDADILAFEKTLSELNEGMVTKSPVLQHLRTNLSDMSSVVSADSAAVDITPVARRLRDLSKGVDVTFATTGAQAFPLSKHGMGTRSLASLLVFRAFMSWRYTLAEQQGDQTHSLLALEEPESHLHPQAQRALFAQIKSIPGQRIVSTHSPYFAGQAKLGELRLFTKHAGVTQAKRLPMQALTSDDVRKLERSVIASRGDLLFARAVVLFEGETEEQAFPLWAQAYWGASAHELGLSFVGVGGTDYFPFIWLAQNFGIPWYVFSDGEDKPVAKLKADAKRAGIDDIAAHDNIVVIPNKLDLEAHLMNEDYLDAFEVAIANYVGPTALDEYIANLNGKEGKTIDGATQIRDYSGAEGRKRAAHDMVSGKKTRYATPLATAVLTLADPERRVPKLVAKLLDVIGKRFDLKKLDSTKFGLH